MTNSKVIDEAIDDLKSQECPNVAKTARKHGVDRKALDNRWKGKTVSMKEAVSTFRQALNNTEEEALVGLINKLTDRRMPPTSAIVKNLAEEIRGSPVGKNWTSSFVRRHQHELKSVHLSNIDQKRVKSEYEPAYAYFYQLVE